MENHKICEFCGTEYDEMLPKCPYCDSTNYKGAEAEYLKKLEDVRDDMEELEEVPEQETRKAFRKQARFLAITLLVIAMIGVLIVAIVAWEESRYKRDEKAEFLWKQQNIPTLNQLYEEEKYEEVTRLFLQAEEEDKPIWSWEHSDFCEIYGKIMNLQDFFSWETAGEEIDSVYYVGVLFDQWQVVGIPLSHLDDQEKEILKEYGRPVLEDFKERWDMSDEEYDAFYRELEENDGWVSYDSCKDYVKMWYKGK